MCVLVMYYYDLILSSKRQASIHEVLFTGLRNLSGNPLAWRLACCIFRDQKEQKL